MSNLKKKTKMKKSSVMGIFVCLLLIAATFSVEANYVPPDNEGEILASFEESKINTIVTGNEAIYEVASIEFNVNCKEAVVEVEFKIQKDNSTNFSNTGMFAFVSESTNRCQSNIAKHSDILAAGDSYNRQEYWILYTKKTKWPIYSS